MSKYEKAKVITNGHLNIEVKKSPFTKKDIDNRTSDYICWDCGKPFLTEKQKQRELVVTAHISICGLCGEEKSVVHYRHWNYLKLK